MRKIKIKTKDRDEITALAKDLSTADFGYKAAMKHYSETNNALWDRIQKLYPKVTVVDGVWKYNMKTFELILVKPNKEEK